MFENIMCCRVKQSPKYTIMRCTWPAYFYIWSKCWKTRILCRMLSQTVHTMVNPFVPNPPFFFSLKTWRFQEIEKGRIWNEWLNIPKFRLISWCGNFVNCAFPQNFRTRKLGEVKVFLQRYAGTFNPDKIVHTKVNNNKNSSRILVRF